MLCHGDLGPQHVFVGGANRLAQIEELESEALTALPTSQMKGLLR